MSLLDYDGLDYHTGKFKTWVKKLLEGKSNAGHKHTKSDITDFPNLGTASVKDVASTGNASTTQVVMGNDTRLSDARKANDVYDWAKSSTKPTYTASEVGAYTKSETDTKLNSKINTSLKGSANGLAELDSNGKVPSTQLPSFVDDVIEGYLSSGKFYKESAHTTQISGESGKIYIDLSTEKTYRWSGSAFVVISETLALGETSSTAYRGDRGKTAYDHSQSTHARIDATKVEKSSTNGNIKINGTETTVYTHPSGTNPHGTTKSDVGLGNVGNFKAVSTVSNQGLSDTEKSNARSNIGAQVAGSYASSTHTHDDRYYTESEIDSKLGGKANSSHTHTKSQITDFPTSMPANGGNSTTVNGHTVNSDVPANAKFTDTTYNIATTTANGLMSKEDKTKLNGLDDIESVKSFIPLFGTTKGRGTIADALHVDLNDVNGDANKIGYVYNGGSTNLPDYCGFGIREVYYYNPTNVFVKIVGWDNYYSQITSWYNIYSSDHWVGWTKHVSNTDLKTISDSLELRLPKHFISSPTTNIDEINETCLVYYSPASNGGTHPGDFPADGTGFVMSYAFDGNFIRQIAFSSWGNIFKTRQKINGTWSAWTQIIDSTGGTINGQLYAKYFRLTDNLWNMGVTNDSNNMSIYPNTGAAYGLGFYAYNNPTTIIRPQVDNFLFLGHSSYRFAEIRSVNVYISSGTAVTSDKNYKNTINELDETISTNFIMALKPSSFKYNDGQSGRLHYGLIAQDVEEAMNENNISTQDFAGLVIEKLTKLVERQAVDENGEPKYKDVLDEAGNPVIDKETGENVTEPVIEEYLEETGEIKYDLRYDEFIAPMIKVIQKQNNEITELKREIEELKTLIITHINGGTN